MKTLFTLLLCALALCVSAQDYTATWTKEQKNKMYENCVQTFISQGYSESDSGEMSACFLTKLTAGKAATDFFSMANYELVNYIKPIMLDCEKTIAPTKITKSPEQEKAEKLGNQGWKQYEAGDYLNSILSSQDALALYPDLSWVRFNLGLCRLILFNKPGATKDYIDAIYTSKKRDIKSHKEEVQAAFDDLIAAEVKLPYLKY